MAGEGGLPADERARRWAGRIFRNSLLLLVLFGVLGGWASLGVFTLEPGEAAVLLRLGAHAGTVSESGLHINWPPPILLREVVDTDRLRNEDFGFRGREDETTPREGLLEATMQTSDNNIVRVGFAVQYEIKDAFAVRYRLADPDAVIRDAAQAVMREVVGRETVDGVLRERRAAVTSDVHTLLQDVLDSYGLGVRIRRVLLQDVQPPAPVRAAFDDVVRATQDASRVVNEAEGYRNELIPGARAEATELLEAAHAQREARIALAVGEATRFSAIAVEYHKAPEVTERRLYLETMELVLPSVDTVLVEPGTAQVLPILQIGRGKEVER